MTGPVWVMPSLDVEFRHACLAGMHENVRDRTLVLDNVAINRGVAASWNLGRARMLNADADWLVIVSESMRFGEAGGTDFEAALQDRAENMVGAVCDQTCTTVVNTGQGFCRNGYGWHLIAISADTFRAVGRFDEVFWPAWWEDADFLRRMNLAGCRAGPPVTGIDAHLIACEHSAAAGLVKANWGHTVGRYEAKWGGRPGEETFDRPYNDPRNHLTKVSQR